MEPKLSVAMATRYCILRRMSSPDILLNEAARKLCSCLDVPDNHCSCYFDNFYSPRMVETTKNANNIQLKRRINYLSVTT